MSDEKRLTLADLIESQVFKTPPTEEREPLVGVLDSPAFSTDSQPFTLTPEILQAAFDAAEAREMQPMRKICNPAAKCRECGKRVVDHSREEGNAHVHSLPGLWQ